MQAAQVKQGRCPWSPEEHADRKRRRACFMRAHHPPGGAYCVPTPGDTMRLDEMAARAGLRLIEGRVG